MVFISPNANNDHKWAKDVTNEVDNEMNTNENARRQAVTKAADDRVTGIRNVRIKFVYQTVCTNDADKIVRKMLNKIQ